MTKPSFDSSKRFLTVKGSVYQRAFQQGATFKDDYGALLDGIKKVPVFPSWIQKRIPLMAYELFFARQGRRFLKNHGSLIRECRGSHHMERVHGLADGFGLSSAFIYGVNAFEVISSQLPYSLGCTSLAFGSRHTSSGEPLLAYNHDFPTSFKDFLIIRRNLPDEGYASLNITYPIIMGAIGGVNEKGLAASLNHAFATDVNDSEGVFITALLQECLDQCATVDEALALIRSTPVPNGSMITLMEDGGHRVVVEFSCTKMAIREADEDVQVTFNKYEMKSMEEVEIPLDARGRGPLKGFDIHEHSIARKKRFKQLHHKLQYSEEDIQEIMSDHEGEQSGTFHSLCRHHPQTADTILSAIIKPCQREMRINIGFPCTGKYRTYQLHHEKIRKVA